MPADPQPQHQAEELGRIARQFGDPRTSNPYLEHRRNGGPDYLVDRLVAAWWRGWDRGAAAVPYAALPQGRAT